MKKILRDNIRVKWRCLATPTLQTMRMFAGWRPLGPLITLNMVNNMDSDHRDGQVLKEVKLACQHFC